MKNKLSSRFWLALTIFSLMGQVAWVVENMYFNVFIYKMFHASAADISAMVTASAVTATLTTVFMGALSDKVGKRKLFIRSAHRICHTLFDPHNSSRVHRFAVYDERISLRHGCVWGIHSGSYSQWDGGALPGGQNMLAGFDSGRFRAYDRKKDSGKCPDGHWQ